MAHHPAQSMTEASEVTSTAAVARTLRDRQCFRRLIPIPLASFPEGSIGRPANVVNGYRVDSKWPSSFVTLAAHDRASAQHKPPILATSRPASTTSRS